MKKPLIGITPLWDEKRNSLWMLPGYMEGIESAGGIPVMLPLTEEHSIIEQLTYSFDGFLFTGGHDVSPELYGQKPGGKCGELCGKRDTMERQLFKKVALEQDRPVFGICRGIQLFNVLLGGTLYQDLPSQFSSDIRHQQTPPYDIPVHTISILTGTPLGKLIHVPEIQVNSYHHQAIHQLADKLRPMALSEDGLIEAVSMTDRKFVQAVQWHPEFMPHDPYSKLLFQAFIEHCVMC